MRPAPFAGRFAADHRDKYAEDGWYVPAKITRCMLVIGSISKVGSHYPPPTLTVETVENAPKGPKRQLISKIRLLAIH
jgi:hypothetical protein